MDSCGPADTDTRPDHGYFESLIQVGMEMKRILAVGALLGTAVSANAADLAPRMYSKAPVLAAVYDWTGFYIGGNAGYGVGRSRTSLAIPGNSFDTAYLQERGGIAGGQIGYNWQTNLGILGPVLFGVEADIQGADLRDRRTSLIGFPGGIASNYDQRLDWFSTVRGRLGLVTGSTVSYVTAGYAYGNVRTSLNETVGAASGTFTTDRGRSGYVIGSGVEAALGGNWTGKIEYLYLDLGKRGSDFTLLGVPQTLDTRTRENIFRVGLNYRFGGNATLAPIPAANWGGFYLGGNVGTTNAQDTSSLVIPATGTNERFNLAPDGYNAGVQAGYNWQAANLVFGIEGDFQGAYARDKDTCIVTCSAATSVAIEARLPWFATARGRIGYSIGSTLFYATGGYATGEVKTRITEAVVGLPTQTFDFKRNRSGYTVGGGIETPFTFLGLFGSNWTVKTEYLYVDLGRTSDTFTFVAGVPQTFTTRVNEHVFRTGINYHFNSPVVARY